MALATKCPHCNTIFRVAADQLKLRGGIVRCGTCREVFDGNAALVDPAAASPFLTSHPATATPPLSGAAPLADSLPSATDDEPIYSLDFDTSFDPFGILPETAQLKDDEDDTEHIELDLDVDLPADVPAAAPADIAVAAPAELPEPPLPRPMAPFKRRQVDEAPAFATYLRDSRREPNLDGSAPASGPDVEKISLDKPVPAAVPPAAPAGARQEPTLAAQPFTPPPDEVPAPEHAGTAEAEEETEAAPAPADDEPAFVIQGRRREQSGKALRVAMALGSLALLLILVLQVMTTFRNPLAAQFPQWKPTLAALCSLSGCQVDLPAQIEALAIEQGELQTLKEQTFSYVSLLRNHSRSVQAWPSIELTLNDANDKPVLRRVIAPRDYLPANIDVAKGLAPRSEQTIKVYFALDQLTASGYHIAIFYP
ncbi:DUF3426 domain-containing protein [Janthinobacterium sp. 1_2014MBL_MicDiv]|uniref:DUF3426 domain-containing protein n=1 Tax=Janthinobacterium sp. 1_2014MBL_MicDiv TaxID=1644131 RepID=UPI0008F4DF15|nr:DUF3426 domain-containing protein [Janthinobacterium sp. 1_2014MBL_MicDiv]APA66864.1 hypothetical protein YQ44_02465 [Janthinobacterium sp. 1_2014MBL_MicDiv]